MNPWQLLGDITGWLLLVVVCAFAISILVFLVVALVAMIKGARNPKPDSKRII